MDCDLITFVIDKDELRSATVAINPTLDKTYKSCFQDSKIQANRKLEIESVLDYLHDELNTGHWSKIPITIRRAFSAASFVKTIILLKSSEFTDDLLKQCLKTVDLGLLLGAPLQVNSELLTNCATFLSKKLNERNATCEIQNQKRKHENKDLDNLEQINGVNIDTIVCPSLETFNNKYFVSQKPVKLQDCVTHWPALSKWPDITYLLKTAGDRTVPVEIGSHYADENWGQKLMTLKEFITNYFYKSEDLGYLAQHNLFDQIPELRNDIYIPEYCCLGQDDNEPEINAWFGPAKTISPLHHDPKNNFLVQVFGTKQLILYSPDDTFCLYPHESTLLSNTAQVDPFNPDLDKYPNFRNAKAVKCILEAGEMLYIPPKWWHHVTALEKSFSVSFWWS
ncbi:Lysine-specific demethylase 8-like Protein [Tribolium castaneum]|uniref:Lysine-specific demethylase 8-like Protein n=1 Tax=Tribolium castaneum TaxID=7070 RepID=D6WDE4_TRICA|nr:PREDICTED: lysine-specific demethylase 8 isoform X1 [Tribolium castaneum]EEZ99556.1 Lysine-specific demethylase 8-like Protein [Tribolium castaneum]|eukprot:XP_972502.1 PREDICTED: lysine-specific demethylase 8 isoform X1 [Tribolium castaneum]